METFDIIFQKDSMSSNEASSSVIVEGTQIESLESHEQSEKEISSKEMEDTDFYQFPPPISGCLLKRYPFGFWSKRFCCILGTQLLICKDEKCSTIDLVFDLTPDLNIEILSGTNSSRFYISDRKSKSITLDATTTDNMMYWIFSLRSYIFQNKKMSLDNFNIISVIGRGFYGKVMLVEERKTKKNYAIKSVRKSKLIGSDKINTVLTERDILSQIHHPFIIGLDFAFQTASKFYFGLEYAPGGELFHHMQMKGVIPINDVQLYIAQIAMALDCLHKHHIIYRDLKPENILLDSEGYIKLTDFGMAKFFKPEKLDTPKSKEKSHTESSCDCGYDIDINQTSIECNNVVGEQKKAFEADYTGTFCGTPEYIAPEIVKHKMYSYSVDYWALGILTYELLFGFTPFADDNRSKLFHGILTAAPKFPKSIDNDVESFILGLLQKNPRKRLTFEEIKRHPFFNHLNFDDLLKRKIKPEFVPIVTSEKVPDNFDKEFTNEQPVDSFIAPVFGEMMEVEGFAYTSEEFLRSESSCPPELSDFGGSSEKLNLDF